MSISFGLRDSLVNIRYVCVLLAFLLSLSLLLSLRSVHVFPGIDHGLAIAPVEIYWLEQDYRMYKDTLQTIFGNNT